MIEHLPVLYPLGEGAFIVNEADRRGYAVYCRRGLCPLVPAGVDRVQNLDFGEFEAHFLAVRLTESAPMFGYGPYYRDLVKKYRELGPTLPGEAILEVDPVFRAYGFGQLYGTEREARQNLRVYEECVKIGSFYVTVLSSSAEIDFEKDRSLRVNLLTAEGGHRTYYLLADESIGGVNERAIRLKLLLEMTGEGYYEPKGVDEMQLIAAAFPGNCFVKGMEL